MAQPNYLSPDADPRSQIDIVPLEIWSDHVPIADKPGEFREVHKIKWTKRGQPGHETVESVGRLRKDEMLWAFLEPYYERWLKGQEDPVDGTPLEAWPGVTRGQVQQMRNLHIRSVEELAGVTDAILDRIGMGARSLRERARTFVQAKAGSAQIEAALVAERERSAALEERIAEMEATLEQLKPKRGRKQAEDEAA